MGQAEFLTLRKGAEVTGEVVDRRSRFIAQIAPVSSEAEAGSFIERVRSRHRDARHNVPAWLLSDGREHCSDDGEPQRSAGMPTLEVLRGAGLADVCCVVTRYFGGTLLGTGGLVRAYAAATQAAVAAAQDAGDIVRMALVRRVTCVIPYGAYERVKRMVMNMQGRVKDSIFAKDVQMNCVFPSGSEGAFVEVLRELSGGEELCIVGEPMFGEL